MALDDPVVLILFLGLFILRVVLVFPCNRTMIIRMLWTFLVLVIGFASLFVFQLFFGIIVLVIGAFLTIVLSKSSKVLTAN
jgi:hypothetical protein